MNKITDEQLSNLQDVLKEKEQVIISIGNIEVKKHSLLHNLSNTEEKINKMSHTLKEEYGDVDININTGEIINKESE